MDVSHVANFWFSSHNFGEAHVAVIKKIQYLQISKIIMEFCMGRPCWMLWHVIEHAAPYKTLYFGNIEIFELQLLRQNYD